MTEEDERFRALASPVRRDLLRLVRDRERPVGELAAALRISQPATSQHLAVLRDSGLVTMREAGRHRYYRADHAALLEVRRFFDDYWSDALDRLADVAEQTSMHRRDAS